MDQHLESPAASSTSTFDPAAVPRDWCSDDPFLTDVPRRAVAAVSGGRAVLRRVGQAAQAHFVTDPELRAAGRRVHRPGGDARQGAPRVQRDAGRPRLRRGAGSRAPAARRSSSACGACCRRRRSSRRRARSSTSPRRSPRRCSTIARMRDELRPARARACGCGTRSRRASTRRSRTMSTRGERRLRAPRRHHDADDRSCSSRSHGDRPRAADEDPRHPVEAVDVGARPHPAVDLARALHAARAGVLRLLPCPGFTPTTRDTRSSSSAWRDDAVRCRGGALS